MNTRKWNLLALLIALILTAACSRQPGVLASNPSSANPALPFERLASTRGISPTAKFAPVPIPVGAPILIRLSSALSSAGAQAGDSFEAVLAQPIVIQGHVLAAGGSSVTGKVIAARAASRADGPGYLRLTLSTIVINGASVSVQTSSLFAKGLSRSISRPGANPGDATFSTTRKFTFRFEQTIPASGGTGS